VRVGATLKRLLSISHLALDYPWATLAFWAALSILGVFSFLSLKLALFPDITFPVVVVDAHTTQFDPLTNERQVTTPLERALSGIGGITSMHSSTYPEFVVIDVSFDIGADLATRRKQVAAAIAGVSLPKGTTTGVTPIDLNETYVVTYALTSDARSPAEVAKLAGREVAPRLRALPGVLKVEIVGGTSSGSSASAYRYDGKPAIAVAVVKQAGANALDVAEACDDTVAALAPSLPGVTLIRASSQATFIREASRATQEALGLAVFLAILVILPFLWDWRATAISALAIPVSLLGTAVVMRVLHFNLETITLLALALVVGVIVDDAIVAVENVVRHLEDGETPREAALNANKEIGRTLVATTLAIVAVFLPIGLMRGTLGQFFKPFGLTASAAVLFSLLAARTLTPTLAAALLRPRPVAPGRLKRERHPNYRRGLEWALGHRTAVVALALLAFAAGLALIPFIPKGFIPHLDRGEFDVNVAAPIGTSLSETAATAATIETAIRRDPDVAHTYTTIGGRAGLTNQALIVVGLRPDRHVKTIDVEDRVRGLLPQIDGVTTAVADVPFVGSDTAKPFQIALLGTDLATLRDAGRAFEHRIQKLAGFVDVTASGLSDGTPFSAIDHVDGKRAVQIQADLAPGLRIGDANDAVAAAARQDLPADVKLTFGGSSADVVTTFRDFGFALALSVVAIVAVLVALFRSWLDPLVITVSLPLSIVGALFALWITHSEFGLISLMGVIFLFGLVNKNAILLVDSIERLRRNGLERRDAILAAGSQRLRPILMTTAATILGMLPIALGFGAGAELRAPMAVAIIGGLITSTLLSLIVIPVAYTLVDDLGRRA
jgi:multidrug efflux pump subunit AcrB